MPHPLADHPDAPAGIIVRHADALALVGLDIRGEGGGEWSLYVIGLLSVGGGDIDASLEWVNARNRRFGIGRYCSAASREAGVCAVTYDTWIPGAAFAACMRAEPREADTRLAAVLMGLIAHVIDTSARESREAAEITGGRVPGAGEVDVQTLLVIALS